MKKIKEINDSQLTELLQSNKKFVVKFSAPWCGPCKALNETLKPIVDGNQDIEFVELNVELNPQSTKRFMVRALPTVIGFNGSDLKFTFVGLKSSAEIEKELTKI